MTRKKNKENEIEKAWQSWELILYSRLKEYAHLIDAIVSDMAAAGMPKAKGEEFIHGQIGDMLEQIKEQMAAEKKVNRGRRAASRTNQHSEAEAV